MNDLIYGFLSGQTDCTKKSRLPAIWDKWQSITGLILTCFILLHMIFTSTILLGKDFFDKVIGFAEADFLIDGGFHLITNFIATFIFIVFIAHAFLAMRKFPANFKQYLIFRVHKARMRHIDTTLWWFQFLTGFALFFSASGHLLNIIFNTDKVNAEASAANFATLEFFYPLLLLFMVVHGGIGMYRLYVKWISIEGLNKQKVFEKRKKIRTTIFFIYGFLALVALIADFAWINLSR